MTAFAALLFWLSALVPISAPNAAYLEVAQAVVRYFPAEARQTAMCVAYFENREYEPTKVSPTGDYGIMQINIIHAGTYDWSRIFEVDYNVAVAADIQAKQGFNPWTTYWVYCRR